VCSAANLSTYCVTAHCEIVRILGIEGPEPEQIALDHTSTKRLLNNNMYNMQIQRVLSLGAGQECVVPVRV